MNYLIARRNKRLYVRMFLQINSPPPRDASSSLDRLLYKHSGSVSVFVVSEGKVHADVISPGSGMRVCVKYNSRGQAASWREPFWHGP